MVKAAAVSITALAVCSGCADRSTATLVPEPAVEATTDLPVDLNRDIDLLFVIDNSHSMETEQASLGENFPKIIDALDSPGVGLPSLHIGVITTDLGGGTDPACQGGDGGKLLRVDIDGCVGPDDAFISDVAAADGSRIRNYSGTLADTFACIAHQGANGCGFEQPLEAVRRALDGNPANAGFVRDHAYLAIVIVSDEDDCSAFDHEIFDTRSGDIDSALGPPSSFRCFEFGVECDGDDPRAAGPKQGCAPRVGSPYLHDVSRYSDFLRSLKPFEQQLVLATISGPLSPVVVERSASSGVDLASLAPSCENENGEAVPPIRLTAALQGVGVEVEHASICGEDLTGAVSQLATFIDEVYSPCVRGELADTRPETAALEPECTVTELSFEPGGGIAERVLVACSEPGDPLSSSEVPCYTMLADASCETPSGLTLAVHYPDGYSAPPLTRVQAACRTE